MNFHFVSFVQYHTLRPLAKFDLYIDILKLDFGNHSISFIGESLSSWQIWSNDL